VTATISSLDTESPTITAPGDITVTADPRQPSAVVTFPLPSATDDLDPSPTVVCAPPSGSAFPVGQTPVTCIATDFSGNTASVTFTVTVECGDPKNDPKDKKEEKGKDCKGV
jgi:HYR domain